MSSLAKKTSGSEQGDLSLMVVMSIPLLFAVIAFVIDGMLGFSLWSHENTAIHAARENCMTPAFALRVKNSETPSKDTADHVVASLRESGIEGKVTVWFYEAPEKEVPPSKRLFVVGIQIEDRYNTMLACGFGLNSFPVSTHITFSVNPYSETKTWRPRLRNNGVYTLEAGAPQSALVHSSCATLDDYPSELVAETRASIERLYT